VTKQTRWIERVQVSLALTPEGTTYRFLKIEAGLSSGQEGLDGLAVGFNHLWTTTEISVAARKAIKLLMRACSTGSGGERDACTVPQSLVSEEVHRGMAAETGQIKNIKSTGSVSELVNGGFFGRGVNREALEDSCRGHPPIWIYERLTGSI
jgi:hypothetical protein